MGYIPVVESLDISSTTFTHCAPKATEFAEVGLKQNNGHYAAQLRSFKVTDFDTSRKLICDKQITVIAVIKYCIIYVQLKRKMFNQYFSDELQLVIFGMTR